MRTAYSHVAQVREARAKWSKILEIDQVDGLEEICQETFWQMVANLGSRGRTDYQMG